MLCWWICRCSGGRPGWCGPSSGGDVRSGHAGSERGATWTIGLLRRGRRSPIGLVGGRRSKSVGTVARSKKSPTIWRVIGTPSWIPSSGSGRRSLKTPIVSRRSLRSGGRRVRRTARPIPARRVVSAPDPPARADHHHVAASDRCVASIPRVEGTNESVNNLVKRVAFGMTNFSNYRVRSLVCAGKPNWSLLDS